MSDRWAEPTLVDDLVTLRPVRAEDAPAMWEAGQDPEGIDLTGTTASLRNRRAVRAYEKVGFLEVGREVEDGEEWVDMEVTRGQVR